MQARATETKQLKKLLQGVDCTISGNIEKTEITGLSSDSRSTSPGNLFAAIKGLSADGHSYVDEAVKAGCSALLVNRGWRGKDETIRDFPHVPVIEIDDTRIGLGNISATFFDHPDRQLTLIGITGTNGKTTTSFLVEALLKSCGRRPGVIGTVNYRYCNRNNECFEMEAPFTTPESPELFALLRSMADEGITDVIMEVSSHALAQERLSGMTFDIAVFTNLSRDHLDYHADMEHYFSSKKRLFTDYLKTGGQVVIMLDEPPSGQDNTDWGMRLKDELGVLYETRGAPPLLFTCGLNSRCDVHPENFNIEITGIATDIVSSSGNLQVKSPLLGEFNLRNILCAAAIGIARGEKPDCIRQGIESVSTIPGRLEKIPAPDKNSPTVLIDYAHTPDALENVLVTLRDLDPKRIICIFGCGGDRDPGKRALMGKIAGSLSDIVLATSDNPRSEAPEKILQQIEEGLVQSSQQKKEAWKMLSREDGKGYDVITSRRLAVSTGIRFANPDDIILVSGKGHENYQLSSKGRIFFDDRVEAEMQLHARAGLKHQWKITWLQQITGALPLKPFTREIKCENISTDSRSMQPGDLFIALKGENFDGSSFAEKAAEAGAAALLINHTAGRDEPVLDFEPRIPVLLVPDTLYALGELAAHKRRWHNNLQVLALTGSSGKTTVKEMIGAILSRQHAILKTEGNFNNLVGLPLTLMNLKDDHEIAVLEMGMNQPGEIGRLTEIADPDIACIINVQEAHLEGLGDINGVARAKNELFEGLKPEGRIAVNLDDEIVRSLARQLTREKITFGRDPEAYVRATEIKSLGRNGMSFTLHIGTADRKVAIKGIGQHNVSNSLAAAAMTHAAGMEIDAIAAGLAAFIPYEKRTSIEELEAGIQVLNDSYNANPASMKAALESLKDLKKDGCAAAVLGDMLELGTHSNTAHRNIGKAVSELNIDFLAAFGSQAENMVAGALDAGMDRSVARSFDSKDDLAAWLKSLMEKNQIKTDDWILIKGSRGMRMEEVLELLRGNHNNILAGGN